MGVCVRACARGLRHISLAGSTPNVPEEDPGYTTCADGPMKAAWFILHNKMMEKLKKQKRLCVMWRKPCNWNCVCVSVCEYIVYILCVCVCNDIVYMCVYMYNIS